jgi:hypothetical protein
VYQFLQAKAHIFCSEKRRRQTENRGCVSAAFSISYGQAKEMATHKVALRANVRQMKEGTLFYL